MNARTTFTVAAGGALVAAIALALALVATVRAGATGMTMGPQGHMTDGSMMDGSTMSGPMGMSPMAGMGHGAPVPRRNVPDAKEAQGGLPLQHTVDDDTWVFSLTTKAVRWEILPGVRVTAWTFNGTVPGPEIRVPYGQKLRVVVKNELPAPTSVHWHGIAVPNAMDGVPDITQAPISPGGSFTYEFQAVPTAKSSRGGTFLYHSHYDEDRQVGLGLSAPLVIEPPVRATQPFDLERTLLLGEWNHNAQSGATRPPMQMAGGFPNYFTINGKSFPATKSIRVRRGDRVLLRVIGGMQFTHPMHLHGASFRVVAKDGAPLPAPYEADVVDVAPGERYDLLFMADAPGKWVFHCHIGHHLTNDGIAPGGLMTLIEVAD